MFPAQSCRISRRKVSHRLPSAVDTYVHTHILTTVSARSFFQWARDEAKWLGCVCACVWDKSRAHGSPSLTERNVSHRRFPAVWLAVSPRLRGYNKAARHSHMNCAPTGAGYRVHQSTWWSTINMQPLHSSSPTRFLHAPFLRLFSSSFIPLLSSSLPFFSVPLEKARLVSPQRALLQVPDWLLNWHSLKYPSNACRERYVWTKRTCWRQHQQQQRQQRQRRDRWRWRWRCRPALRNGLYC